MTDRIKLASKLSDIAYKCDKTDHSHKNYDLNEIDGGCGSFTRCS